MLKLRLGGRGGGNPTIFKDWRNESVFFMLINENVFLPSIPLPATFGSYLHSSMGILPRHFVMIMD